MRKPSKVIKHDVTWYASRKQDDLYPDWMFRPDTESESRKVGIIATVTSTLVVIVGISALGEARIVNAIAWMIYKIYTFGY